MYAREVSPPRPAHCVLVLAGSLVALSCDEDATRGSRLSAEERTCAPGTAATSLVNGGFEAPGGPLVGWRLLGASGARAETIAGVEGCTALALVPPGERFDAPARLSAELPAESLHGRRVRLTAQVRVDREERAAVPSLQLRGAGGPLGWVQVQASAVLLASTWSTASVELDVTHEVDTLEVVVNLQGAHRLELDALTLVAIGPACPGCEPAAALSAAELDALIALTRDLARSQTSAAAPAASPDETARALEGTERALRGARLFRPAEYRPSGGDRTTRLAALVILGARLIRSSPLVARLGDRWDDVLRDSFQRAAQARDRYELRRALWRLFAELGDAAAVVRLRDDVELTFRLGFDWVSLDGDVVVLAADQAPGIEVGDVVEAIDGRPITWTLAEILEYAPGSTSERRHRWALDLLGRGMTRAPRSLTLRRGDGRRVEASAMAGPLRWARQRSQRTLPLAELESGYLYIDLHKLSAGALRAGAARLGAAEAAILDLRGGLSEELAPLLGIPESGRESQPAAGGAGAALALPPRLAVLVHSSNCGSSERVAAYLRGERGALVVGEPSAGCGELGPPVELFSGFQVLVTEGAPTWPAGAIPLRPIAPDVEARPSLEGIRAGRDELRERALVELLARR